MSIPGYRRELNRESRGQRRARRGNEARAAREQANRDGICAHDWGEAAVPCRKPATDLCANGLRYCPRHSPWYGAPPACPECGVKGNYRAGISRRTGQPYEMWTCPRCLAILNAGRSGTVTRKVAS